MRSRFSLKMTLIYSLVMFMLFSWSSAVDFSMCKIGKSTDCEIIKKVATDDNLKCVSVPNIYRCMKLVKDGQVDVLHVSDTDLYPAGKFLGLKPFLQEHLANNKTYRYKSVFVIKKGGPITNLKMLKDKMSCHTGAGKTSGWTVPVSNLQKLKIIPIKDCYNTVKNVADFFVSSCIPGALSKKFNPFNENRLAVCGLCERCNSTSPYAGYKGALKCLKEDKGNIAFVTERELGSSTWSLLCPDGTVKDEAEFEKCNWASRPNDVFLSSPNQDSAKLKKIAKVLKDNIGEIKASISMFSDADSFHDTSKDYKEFMGDGFFNTFEHYHNCESNLRWCSVSKAEMEKCEDLKLAFAAKRATNKLECVLGKDAHDCLNKINSEKADFAVFDGGVIGDAMDSCKIKPRISENHVLEESFAEASYYAVAVIKKSSKLRFPELKGAKSCHTGYGKTSGWKVPIGLLVSKNEIENDESLPEHVGKYFNKSCVPGALDKKNNPRDKNPKSLCGLCPDGGKECSMSTKNKYYGYTGAFRCLFETDADVAFVKHTTVLESTDGRGKEDWEKSLNSDDYRLLCSDGTIASVKEWSKCYLAKVPSHAMVFRDNDNGRRMYSVLNSLDFKLPETKELLFTSNGGGKNLLFKDSAIGLSYISNPQKFITPDYKKILAVFGHKEKICSSPSSAASTLYGTFTLLIITIITIFF